MPKQAFYHQAGQPPKLCVVVHEQDGRVDLAEAEGRAPFVTSCEVLEHALPGHATLPKSEPTSEGSAEGSENNETQTTTSELPSLLQMGAENASKTKSPDSKKK